MRCATHACAALRLVAHLLNDTPATLQPRVLWPVKFKLDGRVGATLPVLDAVRCCIMVCQPQKNGTLAMVQEGGVRKGCCISVLQELH